MTEKSKDVVTRKLPLPLQVTIGDDTVVTDGFFILTSKEASSINITSIDQDGYATLEIFPSMKRNSAYGTSAVIGQDTFLGEVPSRTLGRGKDVGLYKYYRRPDGSLYAIAHGKRNRKIKLGKPRDRHGRIYGVASAIQKQFGDGEFTKQQIVPWLSKPLRHGQVLKALLDVMHLEGYLEKRIAQPKGRIQEHFKATVKLIKLISPWHAIANYPTSPEQA